MQVSARRKVINKLVASTFDIIGWHASRKAQLMLFLSAFLAILLVSTIAVLSNLDFGHDKNLDYAFTAKIIPYVYAYIILCALAWCVGLLPLIDRSQHISKYVTFCLCLYSLGNIGFIHLVGELSLWAGVLAAGTPIVGWILFDFKSVIISYTLGTSLAVVLYSCTYFGWLDYTPLVTDKDSIHTNTAWLLLIYSVGIPHVFCLLFVGYTSIKHWRSREENVRYMACVDALTHVANRWHFMEQLDVEINRMSRQGLPISLLMIDLDHFKVINDDYGHLVGDQVIQQTAKSLVQSLRKVDLVGRYGGEEFCILLPEASPENAVMIAKRCLANVANHGVETTSGKLTVTVSIGVSTMLPEHMAADYNYTQDLIGAADKALYHSKQNGRNQVSFQELSSKSPSEIASAKAAIADSNKTYRQQAQV